MLKDIQIDESPRLISYAYDRTNKTVDYNYEAEDGTRVENTLQFQSEPVIYTYHRNNRIAIVEFEGEVDKLTALPIAVQYMASNGPELDIDPLDYTYSVEVEKQKAIAAGKPEAIAEKIAIGKVSAQLKEQFFLYQPMYNDSKSTVSQYLEKYSLPKIKQAYLIKS